MYPHPQPVKAICADRRITNRSLAHGIGFSEHWVGQVLLGYRQPSARFRHAVAAYLDIPEPELFRPLPPEHIRRAGNRKESSTSDVDRDTYIRRVVESLPPLTPDLRDRLAVLLRVDEPDTVVSADVGGAAA